MNDLDQLKREFQNLRDDVKNIEHYIVDDRVDKVGIENAIKNLQVDFERLEDILSKSIEGFVSKERFGLTEKIAFGAVAMILVGFMTVIVNFFIRNPQ